MQLDSLPMRNINLKSVLYKKKNNAVLLQPGVICVVAIHSAPRFLLFSVLSLSYCLRSHQEEQLYESVSYICSRANCVNAYTRVNDYTCIVTPLSKYLPNSQHGRCTPTEASSQTALACFPMRKTVMWINNVISGSPCPSEWLHPSAHVVSTNWMPWVVAGGRELVGVDMMASWQR